MHFWRRSLHWRRDRGHDIRLERFRRFIERLPSHVTVDSHHGRRYVTELGTDHPVGDSLLSKSRQRGVPTVVESHMGKPCDRP